MRVLPRKQGQWRAEARTKEQWREDIHAEPPIRPDLPTYTQYKLMAPADKELLNEQRTACHSELVIVNSSQMRQIQRVVERRLKVNAYQITGAGRGIVIDGPPTVGKSTLARLIGTTYELWLREHHPELFELKRKTAKGDTIEFIPVVYLSIPSQATPKDLSMIIAHYVGLLVHRQITKNQITALALDMLNECDTRLIIVDDVHFLDLSAKEGRLVNDHLKYLANHCPATFLYVGHDLKKSGLFLEGGATGRATQTSGRYARHQLEPFAITTEPEIMEWISIIQAMEAELLLFKHEQGTLARQWNYLHDRTGGTFCALSDLIRESAFEAIESGQEAITVQLMDTIVLSDLAQTHYEQVRKRTNPQPTTPRKTTTTAIAAAAVA